MNTILRSLIASAAMIALSGCYYQDCPVQHAGSYQGQAWVQVDAEPPPLQAAVTVRPPKPSEASVWVDGYWNWNGSWVWVDGHWESPRPGYVWTAPVARRAGGRIKYHPGHWRPRDSAPPPVYTQPGEVRVSVRPAASAQGTVRVSTPDRPAVPATTPSGNAGGTVTVRPAGPVAQPGTGTVTVRPAGPAVQPGTDVRRPGVTVQQPTHQQPGATVRPGVRVNTPATNQPGTVRPTQPTGPTVRPGGTVVARPGGTVAPRGPGAATPGGGVVRPRGPGAATDNPGSVALSCQVATPRAPRNGYVTITGRGWGQAPVVRIGGQIAPLAQTASTQLRFQVPGDSRGGRVEVSDGNRSAMCGNLAIVGR
jgi:hypothetical protein